METADDPDGPWLPESTLAGSPIDLGSGVEQVTFCDTTAASTGKRFIRVRAVKPW